MAAFQTDAQKKKQRNLIWNLITILILLATACLVYYFVLVFQDPEAVVNLFPPQSTPTLFITQTPTITPIQQPATWTPTATIESTSTRTRAPTWTLLPGFASETFTLTPSITLTPTLTTTAMPVSAEITYHPVTDVYPDLGCAWLGVGGSVLDLDNSPLLGQFVQLGGSLAGSVISQLMISGSNNLYGISGFEFKLSDSPKASSGSLWIQLFDPLGNALTGKLVFDTFDDCSRNLVKITFTRIR